MPIRMSCLLCAAILLLASLMPGAASAAASRTFTIGVEELDYPPHFSAKGTTYQGFARDLFDAFARSKGYALKYVILPPKRLNREFLRNGSLDFKYPANPAWRKGAKQNLTITYSAPVDQYMESIFVLPESAA